MNSSTRRRVRTVVARRCAAFLRPRLAAAAGFTVMVVVGTAIGGRFDISTANQGAESVLIRLLGVAPAVAQAATEEGVLHDRDCEEAETAVKLEKPVEGGFMGATGGLANAFGDGNDQASRLKKIMASLFNDREIMPYSAGQGLTEGLDGIVEAHHLVENRHIEDLGRALGWSKDRLDQEVANAPTVILNEVEHDCFSAELGRDLKRLGSRRADGYGYTKQSLLDAYRQTYRNEGNWLKAVEDYIGSRWAGLP